MQTISPPKSVKMRYTVAALALAGAAMAGEGYYTNTKEADPVYPDPTYTPVKEADPIYPDPTYPTTYPNDYPTDCECHEDPGCQNQ